MAIDAENPLEVDPMRDDVPASSDATAAASSTPAPPPVVVVQYRSRRLPWALVALLLLALPLGAYAMYQHMLSRIRDYAVWEARNVLRRAKELERADTRPASKSGEAATVLAGLPTHPEAQPDPTAQSDPKSNGPVSPSSPKGEEHSAHAEALPSTIKNKAENEPAAPRPVSGPAPLAAATAPPPPPAAAPIAPVAEDRSAEIFHDLVPEQEDLTALEFGTATQLGGKATSPRNGPPASAKAPVSSSPAPAPAAAAAAAPAPVAPPIEAPSVQAGAPRAPGGPSPFETAGDTPLPSKEEIERQIRAEAAAKQAELERQTTDKSREIQHAMREERLRFHQELREILSVQRDDAGPFINELCRRHNYQASAERFHRARRAWDHGGGPLAHRAQLVRSLGLPEPAILSFLEKDLDPLIGTPGGPRNQNEVRTRAARTFLKRCKPPSETPRSAQRASSDRAPSAASRAPRGQRSP